MVLSKAEVDRSVEKILASASNEAETHQARLRISKLYFQVGDFESSRKFCMSCLQLKPSAPGWKQLGFILEGQGKKLEALEAFIKSFNLDIGQRDIILKVVELLNQLPLDRNRCQVWLEKAEPVYSRNAAVKSLKERLNTAVAGSDSSMVEKSLKDEIAKKPFETCLRVRLLKFYMDNEAYEKAYSFVRDIEDTSIMHEQLEWYQAVDELGSVLPTKLTTVVDIEYHIFHLFAVERLAALTIASKRAVTTLEGLVQADVAIVQSLKRFDKYLHNVVQTYKNEKSESWLSFVTDMRGQLYFHILSALTLRLRNESLSSRENKSFVHTLLLAAFNTAPLDSKASWLEKDPRRKLCERWRLQACDRLAVTGHIILTYSRGSKDRFLENVSFTDKEKIFETVFHDAGHDSESYFLREACFESTGDAFPDIDVLQNFEKGSQLITPTDFHKIVWFAERYLDIAGDDSFGQMPNLFSLHVLSGLDGLPMFTSNPKSTAPETVCQLDAYAFAFATALCTSNRVDGRSHFTNLIAPPSLTPALSTTAQTQWWEALIRLVKNEAKEKIGEYRRILQRGIETVRLIGAHRMSTPLVVKLAQIFAEKAANYDDGVVHLTSDPFQLPCHANEEAAAIAGRASLYWQYFLSGGLEADVISSALYRGEKLFDFPGQSWTSVENAKFREEALAFLGVESVKTGKLKDALTYFEESRRPEASFYTGLIYRKWAIDELDGGRPETAIPDTLSSYHLYLEKARDAFHLTLDRLRQPSVGHGHDLNRVIAEVIEDVDDRLSTSESGLSNGKNGLHKKASDDSMFFSTPRSSIALQTPVKMSHRHLGATPSGRMALASMMTEARPSPERLDGQIRALSSAHDLAVQTTMEHYRLILGELKELRGTYVTEMKDMKTTFKEKTSQLEDHLKDITKQISDLSIRLTRRSRSRRPSESIVNEEDLYEYDDYVEQYEEDENFESIGAAPRRKPRAPPQQRQTPQLAPPQQLAYPGITAQQMFYPPNLLHLLQDPNMQNQLAFGYGGFPGALPWLQQQQQLQLGFAGLQAQAHAAQAQIQPQLPIPPQQAVPTPPAKNEILSSLLNKPVESKMPQNVVISTSVTLPGTSTISPALPAVTVPPQHRLGMVTPQKPANSYQIQLPDSANIITSSPLDGNATTPVKPPVGFLSSVPEPKFSSVSASDQQKTPTRDRNASIGSENSYVEEEHDAMPDFKPIIPLPAEVQVKTGEEDEEVLFDERAKLFRFSNKEWKERGVGQIKILKNPTTKKTRIVMRRDQVLKVCANHPITTDLKISYMPKSDNSLFWAAHDYSEGEMTVEKFSARFKTSDLAKNFKEIFEEAARTATVEEKKEVKPAKVEEAPGFGGKFKIAEGQWECKTCYVRNKDSDSRCVSCGIAKPGAAPTDAGAFQFRIGTEKAVPTAGSPFTAQPSFSFGATVPAAAPAAEPKTNGSFQFGIPKSTAATTAASLFGTPKTTVTFSFGTPSSPAVKTSIFGTAVEEAVEEAVKPAGSVQFGSPAAAAKPSEPAPAEPKVTAAPPTFAFGVSAKPSEPAQATKPVAQPSFTFGVAAKPSEPTPAVPAKATPIAPPTFTFGVTTKPSESAPAPAKPAQVSQLSFTFGMVTKPSEPTKAVEQLGTPTTTVKTTEPKTEVAAKTVFGMGSSANGSFSFGTPATATTAAKSTTEVSSVFSPPKFTFGGLLQSVKADATATAAAAVVPDKKTEAKPNIFSAFTFGTPKADLMKPEESLTDIMQLKGEDTAGTTGMLFSSVTGTQTGFKKSEDFKGFPNQGAPVFGSAKKEVASSAPKEEEELKAGEGEGPVEDFVPTAEFKPVIPLPELVEVKTGEEEETALFSERGLLYRFDPAIKEWKEKGRGDFKVMKHKVTGKVRFLMRREQVLKICCNHLLTSSVQLMPMNNSDKAFMWFAQDYSDGEMREEKLALRFKFAETAKRFEDVVLQAKEQLEKNPAKETKPVVPAPAAPAKSDNWDKFKPQEGSWECPGCLCRNLPDVSQCPACNSMKPGSVLATGKFRFEAQPSQAPGAFKFGVTPVTTVTAPTTAASSGFTFASAVPTTTTPSGFTFNLKPTDSVTSPVKPPRSANVSVSSENELYQDDGTGDGLTFEPLIPLPEKVEVKTGEEDEIIYFRHRAKLFRMVALKNDKGELVNEWKERGLGDIKILRHKTSGKCRLIMRREQVHKVCLNHQVIPELKFVPTADRKSIIWAAKDFSESHDGGTEKFLLRFKTPDLVQEFLDSLSKALEGAEAPKQLQDQGDEKEIEVVFIRKPTEEEKKRAAELQLPENFFSYQYKPPCPGCIGCEKEKDKVPAPISSAEEQRHQAEYSGTENDEDDDYEDVAETVLTECFATLSRKGDGEKRWVLRGVGNLKITYDDELYCERVLMPSAEDPKFALVDVVITADCESTVNGEEVEFQGYDTSDDPETPFKYSFRAKLPSHDEALQFQQIFAEGREMAEKMGFDDTHYLSGEYEYEEEDD